MRHFDSLYIAGSWQSASSSNTLEVVDPATETTFAVIPAGDASDVDRAVEAAAAAFPGWSATPASERGVLLGRVAEGLDARRHEIADAIAHELGMPRDQSEAIQLDMGVSAFSMAAELARTFSFEREEPGLLLFEPVGVVGCITPWNYPLNQIGAKVAYALAAGCTVVVKPSELAPVNAFILAEIFDQAGFPPGVFNLVSGLGAVAGEALAAHAKIDMISFTGSTRAGRRVGELASQTIKRVALELGGKSPNVLLEDADFPRAVAAGVANAYANSGQTCDALTRMLVPRSRLNEVETIAKETAESFKVGDPFAPGTQLGPLVSAAQRDRVRSYIFTGIDEGAELVTGGPDAPPGLEKGYFVAPTVFSKVGRQMRIAREEIFGPVLTILPYDSEDEAVDIANDTIYGLSAAVSGGAQRALAVARRIRSGQVHVNSPSYIPGSPFGGFKQSGLGREHGLHGLQEFLEVKAVFS